MERKEEINNLESSSFTGGIPPKYDMASALKAVKPFTGDGTTDINTWVRDIKLLARIANIPEKEVLTLINLSLRDTALSWAAMTMEETDNI